ncbi:hypothetical protein D3C81_1458140 [compost metagenome]
MPPTRTTITTSTGVACRSTVMAATSVTPAPLTLVTTGAIRTSTTPRLSPSSTTALATTGACTWPLPRAGRTLPCKGRCSSAPARRLQKFSASGCSTSGVTMTSPPTMCTPVARSSCSSASMSWWSVPASVKSRPAPTAVPCSCRSTICSASTQVV